MVSSPHEAMHRVFQQDPTLFARVFRTLGMPVDDPVAVTVLPTDLTETSPVERRVDTLLRVTGKEEESFLLAVEAQGRKDPAKPRAWAYYVTYLANKYALPTVLMVVCQDRRTATWAAEPRRMGIPQCPTVTVQPLVVGPHNMPLITDPEQAGTDIPLTVLSAVTHAADPDIGTILKALSTALRGVTEDEANAYVELTAQGLSKSRAAEQWRNLVAADLSFFTSPLSESIRDEGRSEGRAQDILRLLDGRGVPLLDADRDRITHCHDLDVLSRWFGRAITATTAEEVFADAPTGTPTGTTPGGQPQS
ncbi:hypothetical protein GBW32_22235 [Streptomyces tsukubensis]|nr:hypothetical protein [Streptomyces tsukubensis]QFR95237.1 hypothetical protein GBW32_22235 [Streptomyces tsukubensis]